METETRKIPLPDFVKNVPGITESLFARANYEPSGGWAWFDDYNANLLPLIDQSIDNARNFLADVERRRAILTSVRKHLAGCRTFIAQTARLSKDANIGLDELGGKFAAWSLITAETEKEFSDTDDSKMLDDIKAANSDITALTAFKEYVEIDCAVDVALYAMHLAEPKYRVKLFRDIMKQVKRLETRINIIKATKSRIFDLLHDKTEIGNLIKTMEEAYSLIVPHLRKRKKFVDTYGAAALDDPITVSHVKTPKILDMAS